MTVTAISTSTAAARTRTATVAARTATKAARTATQSTPRHVKEAHADLSAFTTANT